jgi:hypothetical protein
VTGSFDTPVLFLVFNRPEHTRQSFETIRARRPTRLFVAADGPRAHVPADRERTQEVRRIATAVDWPCEVKTLLRDSNLGCAAAVSQAITWFFTHVDSGIILEDDCVPASAFWDYSALMLERYRDDEQVMCVSGNNFLPRCMRPRAPYYFSRYPNIWGWATWARAWVAYARVPTALPAADVSAVFDRAGIRNPLSRWWWRRTLAKYVSPAGTSWAYRWTYSVWMYDGVSVSPNRNLVANIGFDADATHVDRAAEIARFRTTERWDFGDAHAPRSVKLNRFADAVYDLYVITGRNLLGSALRHLPRAKPVHGA